VSPARKLFYWFLVTLGGAVLLFGLAGRWDLPLLWAYLAVFSAITLLVLRVVDSDRIRERLRPDVDGVDRHMPTLARLFVLAHIVIGALDVGRFHWSDTVAVPLRVAGLATYALALTWVTWALAVNRFFTPAVRIQTERGHRLVRTGPYALVRHPGYAGMSIGLPASALALGSWWAMVPALAYSALVLRRSAIEDAFLTSHLDGYREYKGQVRYRLFPGLW